MSSDQEDVELAGLLADGPSSEDESGSSSVQLRKHSQEKDGIEFETSGLRERLRRVYTKLLGMFRRFERKALFAFLLGLFEKVEPKAILRSLAPSFLQPSYDYNWNLHPTSWLDGIRGFAAFFVYTYHFDHVWWPTLELGYASAPGTYSIFQLSFIRLFVCGPAMVALFFVLSGYALSCNPIQKIRKGDSVGLFNTFVSSVFRRWFRLFLPTLVSTFITMLIAWRGLWTNVAPVFGPGPRGSFFAQLGEWWWGFVAMSNPTASFDPNNVQYPPYGPQLWTIPREFRGSMILYLVMIGLAKTRHLLRILFVSFFCWYTTWIQQWELSLFLSGMLIADLQFLPQDLFNENDYMSFKKAYARSIVACLHAISITLAVLSLHLLSISPNSDSTPGYRTITALTPIGYGTPHRFWTNFGSISFVTALSLSPSSNSGAPLLQRLFRTCFVQYLGRISFALYITHYFVLGTIGSRIFYRWPNVGGFFIALLVNTILCIWIADVFWRAVDIRAVSLGKWVAEKCFKKD